MTDENEHTPTEQDPGADPFKGSAPEPELMAEPEPAVEPVPEAGLASAAEPGPGVEGEPAGAREVVPAPEPVLAPPLAPPPPPPPVSPPVEVLPGTGPVSDSDKILAVLGYIFGIVALVALFIEPYKSSPFVRLHAVQALALWVIGLTWWVPIIGWLLSLAAFVVAVIAIIKAFQGEYYRIPVLYDLLKGFVEEK